MGRDERERAAGREGGCRGTVGEGEESVEFGEGAREGVGEGWSAGSRGSEHGRGGMRATNRMGTFDALFDDTMYDFYAAVRAFAGCSWEIIKRRVWARASILLDLGWI